MPPPTRLLRPASRGELVRHWLTRTFSGRAVLGGLLVKIAAFLLALVLGRAAWLNAIDTIGDLAMITGALIVGVWLFVDVKQRILWWVNRRLTLSYIFMGFVPVLLVIVFFLVAGLLLFYNISSYMMRTELDHLVEQAGFAAESASLGLMDATGSEDVVATLRARAAVLQTRYPAASVALTAPDGRCAAPAAVDLPDGPLAAGPWRHMAAPARVPEWVPCDGYTGVFAYGDPYNARAVARAVVWPQGIDRAVVIDIPIDEVFARELKDRAGVTLADMMIWEGVSEPGTTGSDRAAAQQAPPYALIIGPANIGPADQEAGRLRFTAPFDVVDWQSGASSAILVRFRFGLMDVYDRLVLTSAIEELNFWRALLIMLTVVGVLFLIIQAAAFGMGLALARSITGAIHELFAGTIRVRKGDFAGRVAIRSRDQLGELSASFNSMTASIEELLHQKAEKERLEQELRIARNIQMSLLPQGPLTMPGLTLTAHCEPAREVGGDYYDFLPIDDDTLGILVADVSGKGTSAALYMAELKGIVLSLSQRHRSPRDLLIETDRIISRHLDSRSFITVTYLVVDLREGTLRYARAGHCPLIYVPGGDTAPRRAQLVTPDGMVVGLQLDGGKTFARLLQEVTLPLGRSDLFVLYTDGLTEAMNEHGDYYGDTRLAELVGEHADLPADELRERILRDIDSFTGSAPQQDDMTMVVLRVEHVGEALASAPALAHVDA